MHPMFLTRFPAQRVIAALMPLCLVWVFIACISICASHTEAADEGSAVLSIRMNAALLSECCPIIDANKATLTKRSSLDLLASPDIQNSPHASLPSLNQSSITHLRYSPFNSTCDPPFERLRILRI
jgi:hypothetical protein